MLRLNLLGPAQQQEARYHVGVKVFQTASRGCDAHPKPVDFHRQMPIFKPPTHRSTGIQLGSDQGKDSQFVPVDGPHEALSMR